MAVNEAYRRQVARLDISVEYKPGVRGNGQRTDDAR